MQRPFAAYEGSDPYVFVCYAHDDAALVYAELTRLKGAGFNIWYDEGISPGEEWSETLSARIEGCAVFLFFITPRSVEREHCRREVNFALEQRCSILAVHLEPTEVPGALQLNLSHRQAILKSERSEEDYQQKLDRALEAAAVGRPDVVPDGSSRTMKIGGWTLDTGSQRLQSEGFDHVLEPKDLSVLLHLVEAAPNMVSTEELLERSWPGVVVGDNALHQVIGRLRRAFGDDARSPSYIETLPRRGYRLMQPTKHVEADAQTQPTSARSEVQPDVRGWRTRRDLLITVIVVLLIGIGWLAGDRWDTPVVPKSEDFELGSVGVLPVETVGSAPHLDAFASIVELELLDELFKTDLDVISPSAEDGPRFHLKVVLRLLDDDVEAVLQITDSSDGSLLWSKRKVIDANKHGLDQFVYAPLFAYLTRILVLVESGDFEETNPVAKRRFVEGLMEWSQIPVGGEGNWRAAERHYRAAIAADPNYAGARGQLAVLYKNRMDATLTYQQSVEVAHENIRVVLSEYPDWTFVLGTINAQLDLDFPAAIANLEAELESDCCHSAGEIEVEIGWVKLWRGDVEGALASFDSAERLDAGTNREAVNWSRVLAYVVTGRYADALAVHEGYEYQLEGSMASTISALSLRVIAMYHEGLPEAAGAEFDRIWRLFGKARPELLINSMALVGDRAETRRLIDENEQRYQTDSLGVMSETFWAAYFLGDLELAFLWLDRTIENREYWFLPWLHRSPLLEPVREHPRFVSAMARLNEIQAQGSPTRSSVYP